MAESARPRFAVLALAVMLVFSTVRPHSAQRREQTQALPANPVTQRAQIITELRAIKELIQHQNALLRSGQVKVVVAENSVNDTRGTLETSSP